MLDTTLREQLKMHFEQLSRPVLMTANLDSGDVSQELRSVLGSLVETSDKLSLVFIEDENQRKPSFTLTTPSENISVRFSGMPMGHEFTSLILAILQVGGSELKANKEAVQQIKDLPSDNVLDFKVYVSLSCQNCPDVVQALNLMAVINPNVHTEMIEGGTFQKEVEAKGIMSVPYVELNGVEFSQGRMTLEQILSTLDTSSVVKKIDNLKTKPVFDVLIIGGGPAGVSAAIYTARKGVVTGMVAERLGGQILDTVDIENFVSIKHTVGSSLARDLESHLHEHEVDIIAGERIEKIIPKDASGLFGVVLQSGVVLKSKTMIVATGANWRNMNIPGEQEYRTKGVTYCPHCDGPLFKGKRVAVIGGGNSGVEAAIDLAGVVEHVTLLEFASSLKADAVLQKKLRSLTNVDVITNVITQEVLGDGRKVVSLAYKEHLTDIVRFLDVSGVFVQIGLMPNSKFVDGFVELNKAGEIVVDAYNKTSVEGVFGAGDVTTVPHKQIVISVGDGAKAALSAFDYLIRR